MKPFLAKNLSTLPHVKHGFFTRSGGVSSGCFESLNVGFHRGDDGENVEHNRKLIAEHFGVKDYIFLDQVHGTKIHTAKEFGIYEGDGIITSRERLLIAIQTADCAPLLFAHKHVKKVAALHAGWRGALGGIIEKIVPDDWFCAVGPCMHVLEVGDDVYEQASPAAKEFFQKKENGKWDFEFLQFIKSRFKDVEALEDINVNTYPDDDLFSHRRQKGHCGVQASCIMLI